MDKRQPNYPETKHPIPPKDWQKYDDMTDAAEMGVERVPPGTTTAELPPVDIPSGLTKPI